MSVAMGWLLLVGCYESVSDALGRSLRLVALVQSLWVGCAWSAAVGHSM